MTSFTWLSGYSPSALSFCVPIILWASYRALSKPKKSSSALHPPVYGPWYLPHFVRGLMAMIRLGQDEDGFLLSIRKSYGPVVYLPWPLAQIFILEGQAIQNVYGTPASTLSFIPIRVSMQHSVFGTPGHITDHSALKERMFPVHARGLANIRLDAPVQRFVQVVEQKVTELGNRIDKAGGTLEIGFVNWITETMFEAATVGLFGEEFNSRMISGKIREDFNAFDAAFPLLASEMVPPFLQPYIPPIARGIRGRKVVTETLAKWVEDGMPGLEEGVIRDMGEIGLSEGFSFMEIGSLLSSDLWALQANAPYAASSFFLYILQSPLLPSILEEINELPKEGDTSLPEMTMKTLASMPLANSCLQETLRLSTSSFSIRIVEETFILDTSSPDKPTASGSKYVIPGGSRIICATRAAHLCDALWGDDAFAWDGERFVDGKGDNGAATKRIREVRGFGGGVSICEGRHLASAELKSLLALTLSTFDITPSHTAPSPSVPAAPAVELEVKGTHKKGIAPSRAVGRPGLGAFQFDGSDVVVKVSRRA